MTEDDLALGDAQEAIEDDLDPPDEQLRRDRKVAFIRTAAVLGVLVGLYIVGYATGVTDDLTTDRVRELISGSGWLGILTFCAVYFAGNLLQVPSNVFNFAAVLAFGLPTGLPFAIVVNTASVFFSFYLVRTAGGQPLKLVRRPWVLKVLSKLETHPRSVVFGLRVFMGGSPQLTYAFAMSPVKGSSHFVGTVLAMPIPVTVICVGSELAITYDWSWPF